MPTTQNIVAGGPVREPVNQTPSGPPVGVVSPINLAGYQTPSGPPVGVGGGFVSPINLAGPATFDTGFNIGGTSGWEDPTPSTNLLSLNQGGFSLNYDIGPNTDAFARSAYNYLDNSFRADTNLFGQTVVQSQDFLKGFTAPLTDFNTTVLPTMFGTLQAQNEAIGMAAVNAQASTAQASIASSNARAASAQSSGGCYITTAVCEAIGEADDGPTLTALRGFRDRFMLTSPARRALVKAYYEKAPALVAKIRARRDWREYLESLFTVYILPARDAIQRGDDDRAFLLYCRALFHVERTA